MKILTTLDNIVYTFNDNPSLTEGEDVTFILNVVNEKLENINITDYDAIKLYLKKIGDTTIYNYSCVVEDANLGRFKCDIEVNDKGLFEVQYILLNTIDGKSRVINNGLLFVQEKLY